MPFSDRWTSSQLRELLLDYNDLEPVNSRNYVDLAVGDPDPQPKKSSRAAVYDHIPTLPEGESHAQDENDDDDDDEVEVTQSAAEKQRARVSDARAQYIRDLLDRDAELPRELVALLHVPHSRSAALAEMVDDLSVSPHPATYLTPAQEEEYLEALDQALANTSLSTTSMNGLRSGKNNISQADRERDEERELALKNPVSVYNWLRRNQPQVFLQDKDAGSSAVGPSEKTGGGSNNVTEKPVAEKSTSKSSRGAGKRASSAARKNTTESARASSSAAAAAAAAAEYIDDDGFLHAPVEMTMTPSSTAKGKRKREEDPGYRPKGGSSSRSSRRKRKSAAAKNDAGGIGGGAGLVGENDADSPASAALAGSGGGGRGEGGGSGGVAGGGVAGAGTTARSRKSAGAASSSRRAHKATTPEE